MIPVGWFAGSVIACGATPPVAPPPVAPPVLDQPEADVYATAVGPLAVRPIGHGSLALRFAGQTWVVDPSREVAGDYTGIVADVVLLTDVHADHLDPKTLAAVSRTGTVVVGPPAVAREAHVDVALANGETQTIAGVAVTAVPMYNLVRGPEGGGRYHERGRGNGYLVDIGGRRVYVSGDTECTPEMKALSGVDIAFVSMNLPWTMPPDEAVSCVRAFRPKVLYPYHHGDSDVSHLASALVDVSVKVQLRDWYPAHR
jgi:L-ascorbate metabolism protein UlaG (beta-lactamase superfamily)